MNRLAVYDGPAPHQAIVHKRLRRVLIGASSIVRVADRGFDLEPAALYGRR